MKSGYLRIGAFRGAPIRLHWTLPVGMLVFSGLRFAPGAWLGFVLLILIHELGHAVLVSRARMRIVAVDVAGFGGLCRFEGRPTPRQRVLIAWGGVMGQAVLGIGTLITLIVFGAPQQAFTADLAYAFTRMNLWLILFNLLPIPPLDGVEAWGVVQLVAAARARRRMDAEQAKVAEQRARERKVTQERVRDLDELEAHELPPMPDEVKKVLDRIMADGRAQQESEKKK